MFLKFNYNKMRGIEIDKELEIFAEALQKEINDAMGINLDGQNGSKRVKLDKEAEEPQLINEEKEISNNLSLYLCQQLNEEQKKAILENFGKKTTYFSDKKRLKDQTDSNTKVLKHIGKKNNLKKESYLERLKKVLIKIILESIYYGKIPLNIENINTSISTPSLNDLNANEIYYNNKLMWLASNGEYDKLYSILEKHKNEVDLITPSGVNNLGHTVVSILCYKGWKETSGEKVNGVYEKLNHSTIDILNKIKEIFGEEEFIKLINYQVKYGVEKTGRGDTPLHFAYERGDVDLIDYLLKNGANPDIKNNAGFLPIQAITIKESELEKEGTMGNGHGVNVGHIYKDYNKNKSKKPNEYKTYTRLFYIGSIVKTKCKDHSDNILKFTKIFQDIVKEELEISKDEFVSLFHGNKKDSKKTTNKEKVDKVLNILLKNQIDCKNFINNFDGIEESKIVDMKEYLKAIYDEIKVTLKHQKEEIRKEGSDFVEKVSQKIENTEHPIL